MATPKSLEEWSTLISNLMKRAAQIRSAIRSAKKVEAAAGSLGVTDWPIDEMTWAIMYNALTALDTEMDTIMQVSYHYRYLITEGRPASYYSTCIMTKTVSSTAPRTYIMGNPDIDDWSAVNDTTPYHLCNPTLGGTAYTDKVSLLYTDPDLSLPLYYDNDEDGFTVRGFAPSCPPSQPVALTPNGRGIEIDSPENLHLLSEQYQAGVVTDPTAYWSFGLGWSPTAGSGAIAVAATEDLVQTGLNMRVKTMENMVYEVAMKLSGWAGGGGESLEPRLGIGASFGTDYTLTLNANTDLIHLFYLTAAEDNSDLAIITGGAPDVTVDWIRMTPVIGQHAANGAFFSDAAAHVCGSSVDTAGTDRWYCSTGGGGSWRMAVTWYEARTYTAVPAPGATAEILYQPDVVQAGLPYVAEHMQARDLAAGKRYIVEFSIQNDDAGALDTGIQPAIGDVNVPGGFMNAGAAYGDAVFPAAASTYYRYRQMLYVLSTATAFDLAFIPVQRGVPGVATFYGRIKDVLVYEYIVDNDNESTQDYSVEVELLDRS